MAEAKKKSNYNPSSPAVEQAARVLLFLGGQRDSHYGLTAICNGVGIHKSKGFSILNALSQHGFITRDEATKTYALGPAFMPLAAKVRERFDITAVARPHLGALADETRTSVLLGITSNDQFYIAARYDGNEMLSVTLRQYQSLHITHGAHGKAVFAFLGQVEQQRLLESGKCFFHGAKENLDRERLNRELAECREQGYAVDNGEQAPGIRAVAAPLFDHTNRVMAGIVAVGAFPEEQFPILGPKVAETARTISRLAGARPAKEKRTGT